ncbi:uncharacterized protein TNCV_608481 [Trichonephila clavipes]|nr:uncharacterized protein TNCV_608481 [Trichonephila clavipes]
MVSDGTEFAIGDIERLFEEARRNTKAKHEKWEKYYNRRRRDVQINVNDWVLIATHPLRSATRKVVAKFKPKFEDQVRIYRHRKYDETEIGTGSSDSGSLRDESKGFDRVQRISNKSQDGKKKGQREETVTPTTSYYSLRPRSGKKVVSRPTIERKTQEGPVRPRKSRGRNDNPYIEKRTRSNNKNARRGGDQQRQDKERKEHVRESLYPLRSCPFANPTPLAHADTSRDVLPRGGTSQGGVWLI